MTASATRVKGSMCRASSCSREFGFEGEHRRDPVCDPTEFPRPARPPRPHFRRHVVEHPQPTIVRGAGHPHVETGEVDQDDEVRPLLIHEPTQTAFELHEERQPRHHLDEAHDREVVEFRDEFDATRTHARPSGAPEPGRGITLAQGIDQCRRVGVSRRLARQDEDPRTSCGQNAQPRYQIASTVTMSRATSLPRGIPRRESTQFFFRRRRVRIRDMA